MSNPGDIADLSQSSELAFRAAFTGAFPPAEQRYWRAIVLEAFDGKRWYTSQQRLVARRQYRQYNQEFRPDNLGAPYQYDVIAEPTQQRWLYALDVAELADGSSREGIWQSYSYQLIAESPIVSKFSYAVNSYPGTQLNQTIESLDKRINLQVPASGKSKNTAMGKLTTQTIPGRPDVYAGRYGLLPATTVQLHAASGTDAG